MGKIERKDIAGSSLENSCIRPLVIVSPENKGNYFAALGEK